jgi:peptide/nickel transport system permease protein
MWAPYHPSEQFREAAWTPPGARFWLGTDGLGRDQWSRLLYGVRVSLLAGTLAALVSVTIGGLAGTFAASMGGWVEAAVMRVADLSLALPWTYALLAARAALPLELPAEATFAATMLVLSVAGWARPARLARGVVVAAKASGPILAARSFGASRGYVFWHHLLPETRASLGVHFVLAVPQFVMAEATLSFLGLGFSEDYPSWGNLLAALLRLNVLANYWWMVVPAVLFALVLACYHTLGRGWAVEGGPDPR